MKRHLGVALVIMLVALGLVAAMSAAVAWQALAQRHFLLQRERQLQAYWLAESGIDRAGTRLLADPAYRGESIPLIRESSVRIEVKRLEENVFRILTEAKYPSDPPGTVIRSTERVLRLVKKGDEVRLERR